MKIVGISDLHGQLSGYTIPEADILCICGDISPLKFQFNIPSMDGWFKKRFIPWCQEQPVEQVYLIAGNHDRFMESRTYTIHKHLLGTKINYLEDSLCEYIDGNGKIWKIWGTPWCHIFGNWSFMKSPEFEAEKFSLIPEDVDILLTHDAAYGRNDQCFEGRVPNKHIGNTELANRLNEISPKLHLTGHLHSSQHKIIEYNSTKTACVSLLDENYNLSYKPLLIDV